MPAGGVSILRIISNIPSSRSFFFILRGLTSRLLWIYCHGMGAMHMGGWGIGKLGKWECVLVIRRVWE